MKKKPTIDFFYSKDCGSQICAHADNIYLGQKVNFMNDVFFSVSNLIMSFPFSAHLLGISL